MANKDTKNNVSGKPPTTGGNNMAGTGSRNGSEITTTKKGEGVYTTGDWFSRMGAANNAVATNGASSPNQIATGSTSTSPEVGLEYTDSKAINKALSTDSGYPGTNIAGKRKAKNLY